MTKTDKIKEREKKWEEANRDKRRTYTKNWAKKNKKFHRERSIKRLSEIEGRVKHLVTQKKRIAKEEKLPFDLDVEYLLNLFKTQDKKCAITGLALSLEQGKGKLPDGLSLDRIIPMKGYVKGNVRFICSIVNTMKLNLSDEELLKWSERVVLGLKSNGNKQILIPNFNTLADVIDRLIVEVNKLSWYENNKRIESLKENPNDSLIVELDRKSRDCCEYRDLFKRAIDDMLKEIVLNNFYCTLPANRTFVSPPRKVSDILEEMCNDGPNRAKEELATAFSKELKNG